MYRSPYADRQLKLLIFGEQKPSPVEAQSFTGNEDFLSADDFLLPVIESDPLLRKPAAPPLFHESLYRRSEFQPDEDWSDSDSDCGPLSLPSKTKTGAQLELPDAIRRIRALERKLASAKQDLVDYRQFVGERLNISRLAEAIDDDAGSSTPVPARDDDSHYFESYGANGEFLLSPSHPVLILNSTTCRYPRSDDEAIVDVVGPDAIISEALRYQGTPLSTLSLYHQAKHLLRICT